jgi:DNA mismatch repair protein MutL
MPDIIKILSDSVANQIAAGEVIQRPASVVKELCENAIDAGASQVKVVVQDSGKTLIQIIDNGSGMSETDARLSFERHATSKIRNAGDLFSIRTHGFRGEALASIAAIAQVELKTRREEDDLGTEIHINGSLVTKQESVACAKGSVFSVRSLFFNVPARRRFLKSDQVEFRHIMDEIQRIALANPEVSLVLLHNGEEIYNLPSGTVKQRIVNLFGRQMAGELLDVKVDTTVVTIQGFIGKPENARKKSGHQFFFANQRYIRHGFLYRTLMNAYQNLLPHESTPSYFLFFKTDPSLIDVNIHPTKTEVKFEDERTVAQILNAAIRQALGKSNTMPSIDFDSEPAFEFTKPVPGVEITEPKIEIDPDYNPFHNAPRSQHSSGTSQGTTKPLVIPSLMPAENDQTVPVQGFFFQLKGRYILTPVSSGLMAIDQKRAHERILFEENLQKLSSGKQGTEMLVYPVKLKLGKAEEVLFKEMVPILENLGFKFRVAKDYTVMGIPAGTVFEPQQIEQLMEVYSEMGSQAIADPAVAIAAGLAASAAVSYGKIMSNQEMRDLVDRLFACSEPAYTPSGNAVFTIFGNAEFEKRFNPVKA